MSTIERERGTIVAVILAAIFTALILSKTSGEPDSCPDGKCPVVIEALADVPPQLRQPNYSPYGQGSCVHASTITILRWLGQFEVAAWWKANYHSGEYADRLIERLDAAGLKYAYEDDGDIRFLEWCARNRVVAGIFYFPRHAVNIVDFNETHAVLLDNNRPGDYIYIPRNEFIRNWRAYGGFAWTLVYDTPPPYPSY